MLHLRCAIGFLTRKSCILHATEVRRLLARVPDTFRKSRNRYMRRGVVVARWNGVRALVPLILVPAVVKPLVDMGDHLWRQALCIDCVTELSAADLSGPLMALQLRFGWLP
jgi:hypothetical protein